MYSLEEFDNAKIRILKYIMYKKRTENEIRTKFKEVYEEELLNEVIEYLKEAKYIDDKEYIERAINNFKTLKNLSRVELKYKLLTKGLEKNLIDEYFYQNKEELEEYERKSAKNIIEKKKKDTENIEIKNYLMKKGYKQDIINETIEDIYIRTNMN